MKQIKETLKTSQKRVQSRIGKANAPAGNFVWKGTAKGLKLILKYAKTT